MLHTTKQIHPPMLALRALEAFARLGSVWEAAQEFGITRSASSHRGIPGVKTRLATEDCRQSETAPDIAAEPAFPGPTAPQEPVPVAHRRGQCRRTPTSLFLFNNSVLTRTL
jgi:hypothetical protein